MKKFNEIRITEGFNNQDPPNVLVLRRSAIRMFPGNQRVATYRNDNYDLEIAIPYNPNTLGKHRISTVADTTTEETIQETAIHHIHNITKTRTPGQVIYPKGGKVKVNYDTAARIMRLHTLMKGPNKKTLEAIINSSPDGIKKVAEFAKLHMK